MQRILIDDIIRQLNELENGSLWFDQSFKEKLGNISDDEAFVKPLPEIHSVAEHVSHMLEWRRECILRFKGLKRDLMNSPDDWKGSEELKRIGWTNLRNALYDSRAELTDLFKDQDDSFLEIKFQDTEYNFHYLIEGIIQHDLYHLGQIGVTIKLLKNAEPHPFGFAQDDRR